MQPIAIVHVPNNLMELLYNDKNNSIFVNQRTSRKFVFKIGRLAGKIKNYFKRSETKVISLISYWTVETILFSIIMLSATTLTAFLAAMFLYLYGTYVIYSAIDALVK